MDAKGIGGSHIGGECRKVAGDVGTAVRCEPGLGRSRVGHRLDGGEGLAGNQEQRVRRLQPRQGARQLMAVHIADKVKTLIRMRKRLQGEHRHLWPQVGAADTDVDDVGDRFVGANLLSVRQHGIERAVDFAQLLRLQRAGGGCMGWRAQQHMPDRALLGVVDGLAGKHRVPVRRHAALRGQF